MSHEEIQLVRIEEQSNIEKAETESQALKSNNIDIMSMSETSKVRRVMEGT